MSRLRSSATRNIKFVEKKLIISHTDAKRLLLRVGYSEQQIEDLLRDFPDPIDTERDRGALSRHGLSFGSLMDRMGASP